MTGFGVQKKKPTTMMHKGYFEKGKENGVGIRYPSARQKGLYLGDFCNGFRKGYGKQYEIDKSADEYKKVSELISDVSTTEDVTDYLKLIYKGQFSGDHPNGYGIYYKNDGYVLKGKFRRAKFYKGRMWVYLSKEDKKLDKPYFKGYCTNWHYKLAIGHVYDNEGKICYTGQFNCEDFVKDGYGYVDESESKSDSKSTRKYFVYKNGESVREMTPKEIKILNKMFNMRNLKQILGI